MIITCPACTTRYEVPDGAIGAEGRTVRCANCRHSWFEDGGAGLAEDPATIADAALAAAAYEAPAEAVGVAPSPTEVAPLAQIEEAYARHPDIRHPDDSTASPAPAFTPAATPAPTSASAFAYEPPFQPRRTGLRMWLLAAALFVVLAGAIVAAVVAWYGVPDWAGGRRSAFVRERPGLALDFPVARLDRRTLADGTEYLGARGTITNTGPARRTVPPLLIVLRDDRRTIVYSREVALPRRQLGPGESMTITEAVTGVPRAGIAPQVGWKAT